MNFTDAAGQQVAEAELAVGTVGWCVDAEELALSAANIETDERGYIRVDEHGQTSAPGIYAAGDVTGVEMLAPQAMQQGYIAASAALGFPGLATARQIVPVGSFTDPEYARVGMTESQARQSAYTMSVSLPFEDFDPSDHRRPDLRLLQADCRSLVAPDPGMQRGRRQSG